LNMEAMRMSGKAESRNSISFDASGSCWFGIQNRWFNPI